MAVQVPAPAGERSKVTEATPEPPSLEVAPRATVARRSAPGSVRVTAGAVLSTRRAATVSMAVLPATSVTSTRRS